jgi:ribose transport system ATP-binding protein
MDSITKIYPGVVALNGVSFRVKRGEVHALVGENGAGKSTLIKVLSGAVKPDSGFITVDGKSMSYLEPREAIELGIAVIYQEFNLIPYLTVAENIFLGNEDLKHMLIDDRRMINRTRETLERLGIEINPKARVRDLSVAYQQMVEIAKAVSKKVDILVMDEPTAPLSKKEVDSLFKLIETLRNQGISIIYISHRLDEVFKVADRVTVLRDGYYIDTLDVERTDKKHLISLMVGREIGEAFPEGGYTQDERVLEVKHLYGQRFKNISLHLNRGEILGIAGLVGAGRSEVGRAIFGADATVSGKIFMDGKEVKINSPKDAIRLGIGLLPEDRKLQGILLKLSVKHNISLAALHLFLRHGLISSRKETRAVIGLVKSLEVKTPFIDQRTDFLSGGNQQKVVLAKWLATKSKILIFDEPTRGIDVGAKQEIYELMRQLTKNGISIIIISSEMPELIGMSDRIIVLCKGELRGELQGCEATQSKVLEMAAGFVS